MKIAFASDIHLEFWKPVNLDWLADHITDNDADIIVDAGDTHPYKEIREHFHGLIRKKKPLFSVLGNHDYYHSEWYDDFTETDQIVGGCLWSSFDNDPLVQLKARNRINDFRLIKGFDPDRVVQIHRSHKERIFASKAEIVVTHFPPTHGAVAEKFRGDPLNGYFVNRLDEEIMNSNKKLWLCGHTHNRFDYMVGNCRVVSNPLGYPGENMKKIEEYQPLILEI